MKSLRWIATVVLGFSAVGCYVRDDRPTTLGVYPGIVTHSVSVGTPQPYTVSSMPPDPLDERMTASPGIGQVWIDGSWHWNGYEWVWVSGRWEQDQAGQVYVAPGYDYVNGGYVYTPGHWSSRDRIPRGAIVRDHRDGRPAVVRPPTTGTPPPPTPTTPRPDFNGQLNNRPGVAQPRDQRSEPIYVPRPRPRPTYQPQPANPGYDDSRTPPPPPSPPPTVGPHAPNVPPPSYPPPRPPTGPGPAPAPPTYIPNPNVTGPQRDVRPAPAPPPYRGPNVPQQPSRTPPPPPRGAPNANPNTNSKTAPAQRR